MKKSGFLYQKCIENSEKVSWKINDILPDDYEINYEKNFVPSSFTGEETLSALNKNQKKILNQIWGASYFNIFAFVEEYITLFTLNLANDVSFKDASKLRAFVRFSEEEIKHQQLFKKYIEKFQSSFIDQCHFIDNSKEVASSILCNSKLAVLILTYHLELITQQHYTESVQASTELDEKFKYILKCHWMEESQHSKLDLQKIVEEASKGTKEDFMLSLQEYFSILDGFIGILKIQSKMNWESFNKCADFKSEKEIRIEKDTFINSQHKSYVEVFIQMGLKNKKFLNEIKNVFSESEGLIIDKQKAIAQFCEKLSQ